MSFEIYALQSSALKFGSYKKVLDTNNDGILEVQKQYTKDSKELFREVFDFDSNGAADYVREYTSQGVKKHAFNNNPDNNEALSNFNVEEYDKIADELSKKAEETEFEYKKGSKDIQEEMLEISRKRRELMNMVNPEKDLEKDIEELQAQLQQIYDITELDINSQFPKFKAE